MLKSVRGRPHDGNIGVEIDWPFDYVLNLLSVTFQFYYIVFANHGEGNRKDVDRVFCG